MKDVDMKDIVVHLDWLRALAALLSPEDVAGGFATLDTVDQAAIFGLFEATLDRARSVLTV
ncbi:hypothetical protein [Paraburkholderia phosphatilytica]|uniref:hypothetical protein n=1 Tax=Paraburkholderia phosphatilytica TaxID=2282883 RepID=UPI000F5E75DD|nr:hypothetical protein [Paraburkholderia phosphatilytica]